MTPFDRLPAALKARVNAACDRFEEQWNAGPRPTIEAALAAAGADLRPHLLPELVKLEVELRIKADDTDEPDEYRRRFPGLAPEALDRILACAVSIATSATPPGRLGRYEVIGVIGQGGMGDVFRVRDGDLGRDLALKVMRREIQGDPPLRRRFVEEAQIGGQLQHPGIVPVYELGTLRRPPALLHDEAGQGPDPARAARAERPAPAHDLPRFLAIFEQVCQTVAYAHAPGRDPPRPEAGQRHGRRASARSRSWTGAWPRSCRGGASPTTSGRGRRRRRDVSGRSGAARPGATTRRPGRCWARPPTWPPEQARGEVDAVDERADVFGLGAILCEVLTGRPPYAGRDPGRGPPQAARADLADALGRLDACGADPELVGLARVCLAAEPAGPAARRGRGGRAGRRPTWRRAGAAQARPSWRGPRPRPGRAKRRNAVGWPTG